MADVKKGTNTDSKGQKGGGSTPEKMIGNTGTKGYSQVSGNRKGGK